MTPLRRFPRAVLAGLVDQLIQEMDARDGDPDLEPDDFDGGIEDDPRGFDPEEDGCPDIMATRPIYGVDQSLGPINEAEAVRRHLRLVRGDAT